MDSKMVSNHKLFTKAGNSLLELMVTVALGGLILATLTTSFISQSKSYDAQEQINEMQQNVRAAMDLIIHEVRLAGYLMQNTADAIPYSTLQLEVRADLDGDGNVTGGAVNERIVYSFDAPNLRIERNPTGVGGEETLADNIQGFTFAYLDSSGIATTDPAMIRQIEITITGRTAGIDPNYPTNGGYRQYTLTSVITPRNLAF